MKDFIRPFVIAAQGDYEMVEHLLKLEPSLAYIELDWGSGEFESGLAAAAHTGSRDIAELLIRYGASKTLFSQAMLGDLNYVEMALEENPSLIHAKGAHGISLIRHAERGGYEAEPVLQYLNQLLERENLQCQSN